MGKSTFVLSGLIVVLLVANVVQFLHFTELNERNDNSDIPLDVTAVMNNITSYIGQILTLEGYHVLGGSGYHLLLKDLNDFHQNTIIPTNRFIEVMGEIPNQLKTESGSFLKIKGKIIWSNESQGIGGLEFNPGISFYSVISWYFDHQEEVHTFNINFSDQPSPNKYAVLISGGVNILYCYPRYWNDLKWTYSILVDKYQYDPSNIIVLYKHGSGEDTDIPVNFSASFENFNYTFTYLAEQMDHRDSLFIFTTNHGWEEGLFLYYEDTVTPQHFAEVLAPISYARMIILMGQCNSGVFIPTLSGPGRIIITAASATESSWSCDTEGSYDEFVYHFMCAVNTKKPDGTPLIGYDLDNNGLISIREAFNYALVVDSRAEHPHYDDNGDGVGYSGLLYLSATLGEEGYFGGSVYL